MIDNKIVRIVKENQFEKGWSLFTPYSEASVATVNRTYKELKLTDIVRAITYSNVVNIILSEACLPGRIVSELEWLNKYIDNDVLVNKIKLNIIVSQEEILQPYSSLKFNKVVVDTSVNFNYIGVTGRYNLRAMLADSYCEIDDTIENIYFNNKKSDANYELHKSTKAIYIANENGKTDYSELIAEAQKNKCKIYYVVSCRKYSKEVFDFAKQCGVDLLVSDFVGNGVVVVNEHNELFALNTLNGRRSIYSPIKNVFAYWGKLYKCCFFYDVIDCSMLSKGYYICSNGELQQLDIASVKNVSIDVPISSMENFIKREFDSSICNKHNEYALMAQKVEYVFTLIPPIKDESYKISSLYNGILKLHTRWKVLQKINLVQIKADYKALVSKDYGVVSLIDAANRFSTEISTMIQKSEYKGFYNMVGATRKLFAETHTNLLDICTLMFKEINATSADSKFHKIDAEIEGYKQTIREKTACVENGVEVLSNKRRVEILNKKIDDLLALKMKFESSSSSITDRKQKQFIERCQAVLSNVVINNANSESIENIVKATEENKEVKLENFVMDHLYSLNDYLAKCTIVLDALLLESIPEDYQVLEKNEQRYIVIDEESEFETAKAICKKFNLLCLARR